VCISCNNKEAIIKVVKSWSSRRTAPCVISGKDGEINSRF